MASSERPKKLQRISQACDLCHRRSIRCRPSTENPQQQCQNCYDFAVDCTYKRPSRRRRNQSLPQISPPNLLPLQQQPSSPGVKIEGRKASLSGSVLTGHSADFTGAFEAVREGRPEDQLGVAWRSFAAASGPTIERYLEVYMEFIYPLFPLFHGPTLWERIRRRHHLTDRGFFASVMAACALTAARGRDGATGDKYQFDESAAKSSEMFFSAAQDAIYKDLSKAIGLGYLRACALLAVTSIQYGQLQTMHQYMGHFQTLSTIQQFHDEEKWPQNLSLVEKEERRRLFWSMYTMDIYTGAVFGTILKSQETHSNVRYPSEISDEQISAGSASPSEELHWLRGWNFTTDLYRVLEHTLKRLRRNKQQRDDRTSVVRLLIADSIPDVQVMENILNLYYQLPPRFKEYQVAVTGDKSQDVFGFQAANIQATLQLVRIILFESSNWHDVDQKCEVAESVLSSFHNISPHYLRAISTPLVYHLGGIGQILAGVMQGILTEDKYQRVVSLLGSMADLLEGLESGLQPATGASKGIRAQIEKIDQFMNAQRQMLSSFPQTSTPLGSLPDLSLPNGAVAEAQNGNLAPPMNNLGMHTPMDEFQLPGSLTGGWPWPFDYTQENGAQILNGFGDEGR